jgi:hypothetical protein
MTLSRNRVLDQSVSGCKRGEFDIAISKSICKSRRWFWFFLDLVINGENSTSRRK